VKMMKVRATKMGEEWEEVRRDCEREQGSRWNHLDFRKTEKRLKGQTEIRNGVSRPS